jgi:hypothetical protein
LLVYIDKTFAEPRELPPMDRRDEAPIACTLQPGDHQERLAWIAALARDGLIAVSREDLRLELRYARSVAGRVREMVCKEQQCCAFLNFNLSETDEGVRLTITAPERARDVADTFFEQFLPPESAATGTRGSSGAPGGGAWKSSKRGGR